MKRALVLSLLLTPACASTAIETPRSHPANPDQHTGQLPPQPATLAPGFDPFAGLPEPRQPEGEHQHHHHHGHGSHQEKAQ